MSFGEAIKSYFANYVTFSGRSRRSAFWFAFLFVTLVSTAISIIAPGPAQMVNDAVYVSQPSALSNLWSLATFLPSLAIAWRRLHDVNKSGLWVLWALLPIVGWIILLIQLVKDSDPNTNRFGAPVK